jgi:hypothetical protein
MKTIAVTLIAILVVAALRAQTPKTDEMTAQKMCADQAGKREPELTPKKGVLSEYEHHYDRVRNVCYLRYDVYSPTEAKDGHITMATVIDAFEDHVFATCTYFEPKGSWHREVQTCFLHPPAGGVIRFNDSIKWERAVEKYFGVGSGILKEMSPTFSNGGGAGPPSL